MPDSQKVHGLIRLFALLVSRIKGSLTAVGQRALAQEPALIKTEHMDPP